MAGHFEFLEMRVVIDERELLADDDWLNDLAFLVDITVHLNMFLKAARNE